MFNIVKDSAGLLKSVLKRLRSKESGDEIAIDVARWSVNYLTEGRNFRDQALLPTLCRLETQRISIVYFGNYLHFAQSASPYCMLRHFVPSRLQRELLICLVP